MIFGDLGVWILAVKNFGPRHHESVVRGPLVGQYIALGKRTFRICQKVMELCHYGSFTFISCQTFVVADI